MVSVVVLRSGYRARMVRVTGRDLVIRPTAVLGTYDVIVPVVLLQPVDQRASHDR